MVASLLVAGTTSDSGKSVVTTALCRAFARRGIDVAPFKAQNMSNNSMVVAAPHSTGPHSTSPDGTAEIGRAQWIQALAAGVAPEPAMNPVLLKPGGDRRSHVVVMGQPAGSVSSRDFVDGRAHLAEAAYAAYDDLASRHELVICEGAGSPTEINLRSSDYVNMGLARHADMPVVVVGDIDRGGVFAALYGTVALLEPADQRLVAGFVINKFRGDPTLLAPGLRQIEDLTGRPVHGVLPWNPDLWLDSEDALAVGPSAADATATLRVAVIRLPRISNFTDVDALGLEADVELEYVTEPRDLAGADLVVVPGTRATLDDLAWLRARGLDRALTSHVERGGAVLGICGGFQMLGGEITDPDGIEGEPGARVTGLGLLGVTTRFGAEKVLRLPTGRALGQDVGGYEIHHGRVSVGSGGERVDDDEEFPGGARRGRVFGTMWHGTLESDGFRSALLAEVVDGLGGVGGGCEGVGSGGVGRARPASSVSFARAREARLDLLADLAEEHLDLDALLELARSGAPELPLLPPGAER
ncbi:adenosylcobyric acid synthase (glutamine-hydrolysing) [Dietzia kunjamensis subsp. schimae]|uniref:Cobyric acid synthase n=2 Tax=Mycobacteriales TaxID=85007 RepID=A0ABY1N325_9ACTN|nr:cobyric acid synthase [Dietzia kunjamensis]SMO78178.1 adenosylcobyric acid synthase (glutamine-hydrolysing) [Dietzia kunjamensis subsp. schimae]